MDRTSLTFAAEMQAVSFSYDGVRPIVSNVSCSFERGGVYALVGPNGVGKSTLIGLLTGLLVPGSGRILIDGNDRISDISARTATVHQQLSLFPDLSVAENLLFGLPGQRDFLGKRSPTEARRIAKSLLQAVGAELPTDARCGDLPFAARQKIEIARAVARQPILLCLDEPTSALDKPSKRELYAALRRVQSTGTTVLFVTHDPDEVREIGAVPLYVSATELTTERPPRRAGSSSSSSSSAVLSRLTRPESLEVRVEDPRSQISLKVPVAPGVVTIVVFDDALRRSETVLSFLEGGGQVKTSVGIREPGVRSLVSAFQEPMTIRVVASAKHEHSVFPGLTVLENAVLLSGGSQSSAWRSPHRESQLLEGLRDRADISYSSPSMRFSQMSGGNQQRLLLAGSASAEPDLLIVEEPLMGVDDESKDRIANILWGHAGRGGRVLVTTCFPSVYAAHDGLRVECSAGRGEPS